MIISKFELLQIRFVKLDLDVFDSELWKEVYARSLYELNMEMIECILENQHQIAKSDAYLHKNLTLILSKEQEPLKAYVEENIDQYFDLMLDQCGNRILDTEKVAIYTLNNASVTDGHKQRYLDSFATKISSLDAIKNSTWWTFMREHYPEQVLPISNR